MNRKFSAREEKYMDNGAARPGQEAGLISQEDKMEMKLLDLYSGAGGCSEGYRRAGFKPYGIDNAFQKHYPFPFLQMDALQALDALIKGDGLTFSNGETLYLKDFAAIHASPPCQHDSVMTKGRWKDRIKSHPDLIKLTHDHLVKTGKLYVIENVECAKEKLVSPVLLCGTMFGLQTKAGSQLRRHRYFEIPWYNALTPPCAHGKSSCIGVYGGGQNPARKRVPATIGVWGHAGGTSNRDGLIQFGTQDRRDAMGIDWMTGNELSEAIPPVYTEFIGKHLWKFISTH